MAVVNGVEGRHVGILGHQYFVREQELWERALHSPTGPAVYYSPAGGTVVYKRETVSEPGKRSMHPDAFGPGKAKKAA